MTIIKDALAPLAKIRKKLSENFKELGFGISNNWEGVTLIIRHRVWFQERDYQVNFVTFQHLASINSFLRINFQLELHECVISSNEEIIFTIKDV